MVEVKSGTKPNAAFVAVRRDAAAKEIIAAERAASDKKTAKLRALRLAKEAREREGAPVSRSGGKRDLRRPTKKRNIIWVKADSR